MRTVAKACGLAALVISAACVFGTEAQAGGRRWACQYQPNYYYSAPAQAGVITPAPNVAVNSGNQRYQSAYQGPVNSNGNMVYSSPATGYYNEYDSIVYKPIRFQDRPFSQQWDAGRKTRGY